MHLPTHYNEPSRKELGTLCRNEHVSFYQKYLVADRFHRNDVWYKFVCETRVLLYPYKPLRVFAVWRLETESDVGFIFIRLFRWPYSKDTVCTLTYELVKIELLSSNEYTYVEDQLLTFRHSEHTWTFAIEQTDTGKLRYLSMFFYLFI